MSTHIHVNGVLVTTVARLRRTRVVDEAFEAREAWIDALLARLAELDAATTHDDGGAQAGHPFYGNQYTDVVLGPKPTVAQNTKSVKAALHELLTSGHPFSLDELMTATGSKSKSNLTTAITHLKGANPHSLGVLNVLKNDKGEYHLDKNQPPGLEPYVPKPKGLAAPIGEPGEPSPVTNPASAPAPAPAPSAGSGLATAKAPATPLGMQANDEAYGATLFAANKKAAEAVAGASGSPAEIALKWKQDKAQAMAQWKANQTGQDQVPLAVEVFKEDLALMHKLGLAEESEDFDQKAKQAVSEWKSATAQAKIAAHNKPTTPTQPKPEPAKTPAAASTPVGPSVFKAPEHTVPPDWKGISADDFASNTYEQSISHAHKALHASASDAVSNKIAVQAGLEKRLAASHHFQHMQAQFAAHNHWGQDHDKSLAARLISTWAGSSGDSNDVSVSSQLAIRDAFGLTAENTEHKAFGSLKNSSEDKVHKTSAQQLGIDISTPEKFESYKAGMRDFALAQYHETQDHLAKLGIKELHLVRGMKMTGPANPKQVKLKLQPASSFTTAHGTAHSFAGIGSMFVVKVPASQVLGSFCTGYGCTGESEVVVLNHPSTEAIQVASNQANAATSMASNIKSSLLGIKPPAAPTQQAAPTAKSAPHMSKPINVAKIPKVPKKASGTYAPAMYQAFVSGDLNKVHAIAQTVPPGKVISLAYAQKLIQHMETLK